MQLAQISESAGLWLADLEKDGMRKSQKCLNEFFDSLHVSASP